MPRLKHSKRYLQEVEKKRTELFTRAANDCEYLLSLGAEEAFIFGSLVRDDFREHSDVDLAVLGLPEEYVYKVESRIEDILGGRPLTWSIWSMPPITLSPGYGAAGGVMLPVFLDRTTLIPSRVFERAKDINKVIPAFLEEFRTLQETMELSEGTSGH